MPWNLAKLSLLSFSYSLDFASCFTFNLLKFKPKYCFKKILDKEKLHFLVSFSFETQFEVYQMTQDRYLKGTSLLKPQQSHNGTLYIRHWFFQHLLSLDSAVYDVLMSHYKSWTFGPLFILFVLLVCSICYFLNQHTRICLSTLWIGKCFDGLCTL